VSKFINKKIIEMKNIKAEIVEVVKLVKDSAAESVTIKVSLELTLPLNGGMLATHPVRGVPKVLL
jgi:hypothetical protein